MDDVENVQMNLFDKIETYPDCTVEVYINTVTGTKSNGDSELDPLTLNYAYLHNDIPEYVSW